MELVIKPDGDVRCIYDETVDLSPLGQPIIRRASHVEPGNDGKWYADLSPLPEIDGPELGPFDRRSDALAAEVEWLRDNWLVPVK